MEAIDRLKSPTPSFQKKLQKIVISLMAVAGALIGLNEANLVDLSEGLISGMYVFEAIGGAIIGTAQTAKADAPN